ncbi:MAG: integrin alpha [Planctomycetota bacterium]
MKPNSGDWLVVGVPYSEESGLADAGRIECFPVVDSMTAPRFRMTAPDGHVQQGARFGFSVAVGDINGDGIDDIVVGAPGQDAPTRQEQGRVFIFFGPWNPLNQPPYAFVSVLDADSIDLDPQGGGEQFGFSVAVGSLDDVLDSLDVVVGIPFADDLPAATSETGAIDIFLNPPPARNLRRDQHVLQADARRAAGNHYGWSVAVGWIARPDPQSPDLGDIVVGVPDWDYRGWVDAGCLSAHFGHFVLAQARWNNDPGFFQVALGQGYLDETRYGSSLALGDWTCDGWDDLALGGPGDLNAEEEPLGPEGRVTIFESTGLYLMSSGSTPADSVIFAPEAPWIHPLNTFGFSLAFAQIDGDPYLELVVGAPWASTMGLGHVFVFDSDPGVVPAMWPVHTHFGDPAPGGTDRFGWSLAIAHRLGTSLDDLVIGSPHSDIPGTNDAGEVFVWNY